MDKVGSVFQLSKDSTKKTLLFFLVFLLGSQLNFAQAFNQVKLDSVFDLLDTHNKFMGSIALSKNGTTVYTRTIGYADVESSKKADLLTKYRIGSISKMFTASLVFMAIEQGKLQLSDPLSNFFPAIENAKKITIANLLQHRSGIFNFTNSIDYITWNTNPKTRDEMLQIIGKQPNVFDPDSKTEYSNSNFVLLTFILEDIFKKPYSILIKEKITEPLGLKNTYVGGSISLNENESNSYQFSGKWMKQNETDMSIPVGAGAIVSNPSDLNTFITALFNEKLISASSLKEMTIIKDGLGKGIMQFPFHNRVGYGHGGNIDGFSSFLGYFEDTKIAIALTSNGTSYNNNDIFIYALSTIENLPFQIPSFIEHNVDSNILETYVGVYASSQISLKITITRKDSTLIAQATGQPSFPLIANSDTIFHFDAAGVVLEFVPETTKMILKQGGGVFEFTKE